VDARAQSSSKNKNKKPSSENQNTNRFFQCAEWDANKLLSEEEK